VYVLTRKAAGRLGTDGFVAHTHRLPVGRWVVSRFRDVRYSPESGHQENFHSGAANTAKPLAR
jgi:hypothetical protein